MGFCRLSVRAMPMDRLEGLLQALLCEQETATGH